MMMAARAGAQIRAQMQNAWGYSDDVSCFFLCGQGTSRIPRSQRSGQPSRKRPSQPTDVHDVIAWLWPKAWVSEALYGAASPKRWFRSHSMGRQSQNTNFGASLWGGWPKPLVSGLFCGAAGPTRGFRSHSMGRQAQSVGFGTIRLGGWPDAWVSEPLFGVAAPKR